MGNLAGKILIGIKDYEFKVNNKIVNLKGMKFEINQFPDGELYLSALNGDFETSFYESEIGQIFQLV